MEDLLFFRELLNKIDGEKLLSLDSFIKNNYSLILEEQYQENKKSGEHSSRAKFREHYFKGDFQIDERTYRRWKNGQLKRGLPERFIDIFKMMSVTEELYVDYQLEVLKGSIMTELQKTDLYFLHVCRMLRGTKMLPIVEHLSRYLQNKEGLTEDEYLREFKLGFDDYIGEREFMKSFEEIDYYNYVDNPLDSTGDSEVTKKLGELLRRKTDKN